MGKLFRLSQVARKSNFGRDTIIEVLARHGYDLDNNPNTRINEEQIQILSNEFNLEFLYHTPNRHSREEPEDLHNSQLKVWEAYIEANEVIIEEKSKPIEVNSILEVKQEKNRWNEPVLTTKVAVSHKNIAKELIQSLVISKIIPNDLHAKHEKDFFYVSNLNPINLKKTQEQLEYFRMKYSQFIESNKSPAIWGKISSLKDDYKHLSSKMEISHQIGEEETVFCTLDEIRNLDKYSKRHPYIRREPDVGVILVIYKYNDSEILKRRINEKIELGECEVVVKKRFEKSINAIKKEAEEKGLHSLERKLLDVTLIIENYQGDWEALEAVLKDFGLVREKWVGEYQYIDEAGNLIEEQKDTVQNLDFLWFHQWKLSKRFNNIQLTKTAGFFKTDNFSQLLNDNKSECLRYLNVEGFTAVQKEDSETLAFDVQNKHELKEHLDKLEELNLVTHNLNSLGEYFKYKVRLSIENPDFTAIGLALKNEFKDAIDFEYSQNQLILYFKYFSQSRDFISFHNRMSEIEEEHAIQVSFNETDFPYTFFFKIDSEAQRSLFTERVEAIANNNFYWAEEVNNDESKVRVSKTYFGKLDGRRSNHNHLVFSLPLDSSENKAYSEKIQSLFNSKTPLQAINPDLAGDKSKNNYLKEAIEKITKPKDEFGKKPANAKLGEFIFDSSLAQKLSIENFKYEEIAVKKTLNSKNINSSQIQSVVKAIHAEDLAILQGPPGTGKTTVIAEIIWQSILKKQDIRILLTSESNLAVDNALSRLNNPKSMLVKPVRFGRNVQENEGKQFQIERMERWATKKAATEDDEDNDNAIQSWLNTIINRTHNSPSQYQTVLEKWRNGLSAPSISTKQEFKDLYLKHINVIGNTCSSAGSPDFIVNYQRLYNPKTNDKILGRFVYQHKNNYPFSWDVSSAMTPVEFNTVIMDEASKATPPELLLPLTFGKKSIIIGDHRQLPPSLNEQDFKETLETIGKHDLAKHWTEKDYQTSQFERLFMNENLSPTLKGSFNLQYRMHPQINEVIKQFYIDDDGLECGLPLDQVDDENLSNPASRYHGFLNEGFISPDVHTLWINVDEPELKEGTSRVNEAEVEAVRRVLNYLQDAEGFEEFMSFWQKEEDQEIGIISFYGKQLNRLNTLKKDFPKLKLLTKTVDRFQGMERNIIIVSTVRSDKIIDSPHQKPSLIKYPDNNGYRRNSSLGFAETPQRLNVALSRAKRLLIIVGNANHFSRNPMYLNVVNSIKGFSSDQPTFIDYKDLNRYN